MGLTSWTGSHPKKSDAGVAKNYLAQDELNALNLIVSPRLTSISFGNTYESFPQQSKYLRHLAFLFGSVSVVSWYFIFVLNLIQPTVFSFRKGIEIYGVVVVFAIIISLLLNQYFLWERKHSAYLS